MKLKKNSLRSKIWIYLIIFSLLILSFLWVFQVVFIKSYYEWVKTKEIKNIASSIENIYKNNNYENELDLISYNSGVCIEVIDNNYIVYNSKNFNRNCTIENDKNPEVNVYINNFINGYTKTNTFITINPRLNNKTIFYGIEISSGVFAFINTSLEPIDSTINILKNQLIYVTIVVLILSFIIAYFISKKLSKPIIKINKAARRMADGEYDVVFESDEDILELNELADTLNYANSELSKTDELRRDLMANVSHDLKTPLTMIKAYAEMVRDLTYKNKEKRNDNLNIIINETDRLNLLVNDILDLSSMQANTLVLNEEEFDLTDLIKNILKQYQILNVQEDYNFVFDYKEKALVKGDKKRIEQVIYNLINNAINYTGKDKLIKINIINKENTYLVEIIDSGKGIAKEEIKLIWDKYYKVDKNYHRKVKGTGLGLSIVKNILLAHKFEYGVESVKNKGTKFYFNVKKSDK